MKMIVVARMAVLLTLAVLPSVGRTDVCDLPMSYEEWRRCRYGVGEPLVGLRPSYMCATQSLSSQGGFGDGWFYSGLLGLVAFFVLCSPKIERRRNRIALWGLATMSVLCVVAAHVGKDPCLGALTVGIMFLSDTGTLLGVFSRWAIKGFVCRYGRLCLCLLVLIVMTGASITETGSKLEKLNELKEYQRYRQDYEKPCRPSNNRLDDISAHGGYEW